MFLWIPLLTLALATASEHSGARRRRRLEPPDMRWADLHQQASDWYVYGLDPDMIQWVVDLAERAGVPPVLGRMGQLRWAKTLPEDAELEVSPEGRWSVVHEGWLIAAEPWSIERLERTTGSNDAFPRSTGERLPMYQYEAERQRRTLPEGAPGGVPEGASLLLAELWLPAQEGGLGAVEDYDAVQISIWKMGPEGELDLGPVP
jgi:hypothetical protein